MKHSFAFQWISLKMQLHQTGTDIGPRLVGQMKKGPKRSFNRSIIQFPKKVEIQTIATTDSKKFTADNAIMNHHRGSRSPLRRAENAIDPATTGEGKMSGTQASNSATSRAGRRANCPPTRCITCKTSLGRARVMSSGGLGACRCGICLHPAFVCFVFAFRNSVGVDDGPNIDYPT